MSYDLSCLTEELSREYTLRLWHSYLLLTVLTQVYRWGLGQVNKQSRKMNNVPFGRETNEFKVVDKAAQKASEIVRLAPLKRNCVLYTGMTEMYPKEKTPPTKGSI